MTQDAGELLKLIDDAIETNSLSCKNVALMRAANKIRSSQGSAWDKQSEVHIESVDEQLWGRFVNHYWGSFEGDKEIVLKHIRAVMDYHAENPTVSGEPARRSS